MKYREIKNLTVDDFIKLLQQEFKNNSLKIKDNVIRYKKLLNDKNELENFDNEFRLLLKYNKELTNQNGYLIELHNKILKFMKTSQDKDNQPDNKQDLLGNIIKEDIKEESVIYKETDNEQIFIDTTNNSIKFDKNHPLYNDYNFKEKLMDYYIEKEEYELCAIIKNA